jgi:hypothetical protein
MQQSELSDFLKYVAEITAATTNGKMAWEKVNPTTYVYNSSPPTGGRIVLQRINPNQISFQVANAGGELKLEVVAYPGNPAPLGPLMGLFTIIEKYRDIKGLDFLKKIVPQ